jgi:putative transposase
MTHKQRTSPRSRWDQTALERRRLQAAQFFKQGKRQADVARRLDVSREAARQWYHAWKQGGTKALCMRGTRGVRSKLSDKDKERLATALLKGPIEAGYATDLWTLDRITTLVRNRFGVSYRPRSISYVLHDMGWSCQKPQARSRERNEDAIRHWKHYRWPRIKRGLNGAMPDSSFRTNPQSPTNRLSGVPGA